MALSELRHEHFAERIGDRLTVDLGKAGVVTLELVGARRPPEDRADHAHFADFRGPLEPFLPQGTYDMHHDDLGILPLFIVPVAEVDEGYLYEAVFTRLED